MLCLADYSCFSLKTAKLYHNVIIEVNASESPTMASKRELQFGERGDDLLRLDAHLDDTVHQVEDIARIVAPQVGVVDNARIGVLCDGIAFPDKFNLR